ncbi:hypothetical protein [Roseobacter sp.]|uniref:hypothetical protein n=1 Tax=Roseobacter sp. TaxID=1907202 RepID=UPI0025D0027A|nr:hypothetical protein [Roseobacter sp.]
MNECTAVDYGLREPESCLAGTVPDGMPGAPFGRADGTLAETGDGGRDGAPSDQLRLLCQPDVVTGFSQATDRAGESSGAF